MELIDTHAHLTAEVYRGQLDAVLDRARQAGVGHWITVGTDLADSAAALALSEAHENMYCTAGVHPHEAADIEPDYIEQLRQFASPGGVCAIGEIGLDYHYEFSHRNDQKKAFAEQLTLARELQLPAVVHCREAFDDCLAVIDECGPEDIQAVFHCFSGTCRQARAVLDRGFFVSLTGTITFGKAGEQQAVVRYVPLEKVFLETDCPYLSPEPKRKVRPNEPALLRFTAAKMAELRQMSLAEIAEVTTRNGRGFFGL